jgi:glycosyltransferase involved in cell wall biosynthesis
MDGTRLRLLADGSASTAERLVLVTSMYTEADLARRLGRDAYSYRYVYRAFAPLLERWGRTLEVSGPARLVAEAAAGAADAGLSAAHLSFLPLHLMDLVPGVPNIGVPAWEFPDLPGLGGDPAHDWARRASELDLLITHTQFSRAAFLRAGVRTPVHVVPVPIQPEYFQLAPWRPGQRVVLDCPCYVFPQPSALPRPPRPWVASNTGRVPGRPGLRELCKRAIKALPGCLAGPLQRTGRAVRDALWAARQALRERDVRLLYPPRPTLELEGVVYTTILSPFDARKNWQDMLSAFLLALRDREDATLVVKLVVSGEWEAAALANILAFYRSTGISHRCKLAFVTAYLSEGQLLELTRASTYYLNTSRAEGSCLPLQNFMAAGRPAIAPAHTGLADSLDEKCGHTPGYIVASHLEPAGWPHDAEAGFRTTWHRLVWQSLHDQMRASYEAARHDLPLYQNRADAAHRRMTELASPEAVWPLLRDALDAGLAAGRRPAAASAQPATLRRVV